MKNKLFGITLATFLLLNPTTTLALTKKETVYTNLDETGNPYKTIVNNHLYVDNAKTIEDETELKDLLNINGNEKFKLNDQKLIWEGTGRDIFYQGTTDKESLISIQATYYLNGKEMKVKDMVGKKGKVEIKLTLKNNANPYTPVVATLGTIISNKENKNITVTNGKVVDTGTRSIVISLSSPGIYENTKIEELKNLDEITISYETTKFSLNNIYIVATPKLLEETDFDIFEKANKLSSSIITIQENMDKIEVGAKELEQGSLALQNGSKEISSNLAKTIEAINALEVGSFTLDSSLKQIIKTLNETNAMLQNENVTGSITQLNQLKQGNSIAIQSLKTANSNYQNIYVNNNLQNLDSNKSDAELVAELMSMGLDQNTSINLVTCKRQYEGNLKLIELFNLNNNAIDETISSLTKISNNITTLLQKLTTALNEIEGGASKLNNGFNELKSGVNQLYNGALSLDDGTNKLTSGIINLTNGITTLNKQGINTLTNYAYKLNNISRKAENLVNLSKEYKGFTSKNADNTTFIYKMKSVK